ncbi:MAG: PEGA domain-containing protein, partial [Myxococcota bacterium]
MGGWLFTAIGLYSVVASGSIDDRVAVLPITSPARVTSDGDIHRAVSHAVRRRMNLELLSAEEIFVANQEGLTDRVKDCGPDVPCISRRLRALNARLGLVVVLDRTLNPAVLGLQLIDTDRGELIGRTIDELDEAESALKRIEARSRELLTRAGYSEAGRLTVEVSPFKARVRIEGQKERAPGAPLTWTLPAGQYEIKADRPGFVTQTRTVDVRDGQENRLFLTLAEESSVWSSPWLWVAV